MRTLFRVSLTVGLLALSTTAVFAQPLIYLTRDTDCSNYDIIPNGGEVYAIKLDGVNYQDWLVSLEGKGSNFLVGMGPGDVGTNGGLLSPNWARPALPTHVGYIFITYPDGTLWYDAKVMNAPLMGAQARQWIGENTLVSYTGSKNAVDGSVIDTSAVGGSGEFPVGANGGIELAFGAIHEIGQGADGDTLPGGCFIGVPNDALDSNSDSGGMILGYNVYRMSGSAGSPPTAAQLGTAANFQAFLPIADFDHAAGDSTPGAPGTAAPAERSDGDGDADGIDDAMRIGDLGGLQNPDQLPVSGDDVMIFQDSASNRDVAFGGTQARVAGTAPDTTGATGYWYAVQPVVNGNIEDWNGIVLSTGTDLGDARVDWGGPAGMDAVDMNPGDSDGPEFISPQADFGAPGLGLTNGGLPLLSRPVFGMADPAPALGHVDLNATLRDSQVSIELTTGMQAGNVQGFNVYRVVGDSQVQVNDSLIVADGGTGNVYKLTDEATAVGRRGRTSAKYLVETVYNDGSDSTLDGPFNVGVHRSSSRRGR